MPEEIYYHSFLNRDRIVHIVDPDLQTCEALSVLFRLEGFQTAFSINLAGVPRQPRTAPARCRHRQFRSGR